MIILSTGSRIRQYLLLLFVVLLSNESNAVQDDVVDAARTKTWETGRRIYRDGVLPGGKPLTAIVAGDVAVLGTQFSCQNCHGRSGMGAAEGNIIVPAIAGQILYAPSPQPRRPAYDESSLARVLRDGIDPAGRKLDTLMPRFKLSNNEIAAMAAYLKGLSAGSSPGVDDKTIRLATVVSAAESQDVRDAVIKVLRTYVDEKNRQTRLESQRPDRGNSPASRLPTVFRKWILDVWTVEGPATGWREQLEKYYKSNPVFALLGGVATDNWEPMGKFCETHEIPCLFPSTNLPNVDEGEFYSVHFSQGLILEARLVASHLKAHRFTSVIQLYCGPVSKRVAAALRSQLESRGVRLQDMEFECQDPAPVESLAKRIEATPGAAIVLWLQENHVTQLGKILPPGRVYLSSTLLKAELKQKLPFIPVQAYLAHPYRLPGKTDPALIRFKVWASSRKIKIRYPRLQSEAFFACLVANDAISHLGRFLVRDYALDMLDHAQPMTAYLPLYPRATIGPGQRFLTKGGYILATENGNLVTRDAVWISP